MIKKSKSDEEIKNDKHLEQDKVDDHSQYSLKFSKLMLAGGLLIVAGILSITVIITYKIGILNIIFSFFTILGGIFALLKKGWTLSLFGGIVGIFFTVGIMSIVLSVIASIIIIFSKKEFQIIQKQDIDNKTD